MEIQYAHAQAIFGMVFGAVIARYFSAEWWGYAIMVPVLGALAYFTTLMRLRRLDLNSDIRYLDYLEAIRKQGQL